MSNASESQPAPALAASLIALAAVALGAVAAALGAIEITPAVSEQAGSENLRSLTAFWIASACAWAALSALWLLVLRRLRDEPGAPMRRFIASIACVIIIALGARTYVLTMHTPALSDDIYRYVFDGCNFTAGENPYLVVPENRHDIEAEDERWRGEARIASRINNPELTTIYLPASQWYFGLVATMADAVSAAPDCLERIFRGSFVLCELALMMLLACALRRKGLSPWWLALYAWHPLPLTEIAGSGHQDVLGIALLAAALVVFDVKPRAAWLGSALLGLAALVKPIVLPIAPIMLRGRLLAQSMIAVVCAAVVIFALAAPLLLTHDRAPLDHLMHTSERFSTKWEHFSSIYAVTYRLIDAIDPIEDFHDDWQKRESHEKLARGICLGVLGFVIIITIALVRDAWRGGAIMLFAMVLLSPTVHPWYLLWALALLPRAPSVSLWIASLTVLFGYVAWGYGVRADGALGWHVPGWLVIAAWLPVYAAIVVEVISRMRHNAPHVQRNAEGSTG